MNNKIYIVTDGEYSDYKIMAVYTKKKLAEKYVELWGGRVEEHDLNPYEKEIKEGDSLYQVCMGRDGNVSYVNKFLPTTNDQREIYFSYQDNYMVYELITNSKEKAIKAANEKRVFILTENLWGNKFRKEIAERLELKLP